MSKRRSSRAAASRASRIVSVCVLGKPAARARKNQTRLELVRAVVHAIRQRPAWDPIDAVMFPAGYFRLKDSLGRLDHAERLARLYEHDVGRVCGRAARWLSGRSPGVLFAVGIDTPRLNRHWNGDQLVAVFDRHGPQLCVRKVFPVAADTDGTKHLPFVVYARDAELEARTIRLASGALASVSVCYDGYLWSELAIGPTGKRRALRYLGLDNGLIEETTSSARAGLFERLAHDARRLRPRVHLVPIHAFKRPGSDGYWQRHGLASASAAQSGALTVGAAHFRKRLPSLISQSPLAATGVAIRHLTASQHRKAHRLRPIDGFIVEPLPGLAAMVRLFEG